MIAQGTIFGAFGAGTCGLAKLGSVVQHGYSTINYCLLRKQVVADEQGWWGLLALRLRGRDTGSPFYSVGSGG
jgi:hypothetical protein